MDVLSPRPRWGKKIRRKRKRKFFIFGAVAFIALIYAASRGSHIPEPPSAKHAENIPNIKTSSSSSQLLRRINWPNPKTTPNGIYYETVDGNTVVYTIDHELQKEASDVLKKYNVPYGAFVAMEPSTGKILALVEYSSEDSQLNGFCRRATYPAASLVKIVSAAAALQTGKYKEETEIRFEGNPYRLIKRKISPRNKRRENNITTFSNALGTSNNVVFGKIGIDIGSERFLKSLDDFAFNANIPFDFKLQNSSAAVPEDEYLLARAAAGFGDIYISPIHAVLLAAAVANNGVMMRPYVVDYINNPQGKTIYKASPAPMTRPMSKETAKQIAEMMVGTVTHGTSSKIFYKYARKLRNKVGVAGKTGTLRGDDPPGRYEWFVGFAPADEPKIAVASLVVNDLELWRIKGSFVAQAVMKEYFGM